MDAVSIIVLYNNTLLGLHFHEGFEAYRRKSKSEFEYQNFYYGSRGVASLDSIIRIRIIELKTIIRIDY